MTDDDKLDALEKSLVPSLELVTDDIPADVPDVTEEVAESMDK